jgi:hypothetical protein
MGNIYIGLFVFLLAGGIVIFTIWMDSRVNRELMGKIFNSLEKKGTKNIKITRELWDDDRDSITYKVEYQDGQGLQHNTTCKVNRWTADIYWKDES